MFTVGEDFRLVRQVRAARVDQIDARQVIIEGDFLGAQVLLNGDREIRAAFHGGVVADDDAFAARYPSDAGDDASARSFAVIHAVGGQRRQLQKGRGRIDQPLDPFARQELAAARMSGARGFRSAQSRDRSLLPQLLNQPLHCSSIALKAFG
jgi:hypothetical protein